MTALLTFNEFAEGVSKQTFDFGYDVSDWRQGQYFFNVLCSLNNDVAEKLRGAGLDPFHRDKVSMETWQFVETNW